MKVKERLIFYDWLADTGATSHITHRRDAFTTYERIPEVAIAGVGEMKARAIGRGIVNVESECDGKKCILELQDVLHVPENHNNLLSLGRWEAIGRGYSARDGKLDSSRRTPGKRSRGVKTRNR